MKLGKTLSKGKGMILLASQGYGISNILRFLRILCISTAHSQTYIIRTKEKYTMKCANSQDSFRIQIFIMLKNVF